MAFMHSPALQERWATFSIFEQLGNVGSEVHRTLTAKARGDTRSAQLAFDRAIELIDLTMVDARWRYPRKKEVGRARELFCAAMVGEDTYHTDLDSLDRYFMQFAIAAQRQRGL